ncbi:MAG: GDSL-type esterase/lipase family protein [Armatimonadota bacterium]
MKRALGTIQLKWRFLTLILALLAVGLFLYTENQPLPMGEGPAGPDVALDPIQKEWGKSTFLIVGLGDSITRGVGAEPGKGYFDLLTGGSDGHDSTNLSLKHVLQPFKTLNLSVAGSTSYHLLERQIPDLPTQPRAAKGIVCITTGGNDLIHSYGRRPPTPDAMFGCTLEQAKKWTPAFQQRLRRIIEAVNSRFPGGCEIFIANIYDPSDGRADSENAPRLLPPWRESAKVLGLYNSAIRSVVSDYPNVHEVDIYTPFLGHGFHCRDWLGANYQRYDPNYWYYTNLEDPNPRGHDAVRRAFLRAMAEWCGRKPEVRN